VDGNIKNIRLDWFGTQVKHNNVQKHT